MTEAPFNAALHLGVHVKSDTERWVLFIVVDCPSCGAAATLDRFDSPRDAPIEEGHIICTMCDHGVVKTPERGIPKPGRFACLALGCRRTFKATSADQHEEYICGKCWRRVPMAVRAERRFAIRRRKKEAEGSKREWQLAMREHFAWERIKRHANAAACGI